MTRLPIARDIAPDQAEANLGPRRIDMLRTQITGLFFVSFLLPAYIAVISNAPDAMSRRGTWITAIVALAAALTALIVYRRVTAFPGARGAAYVTPAFSATFGIAATLLLLFRLNYSSILLLSSFLASTGFGFFIAYARQRGTTSHFYLVPFGKNQPIDEAPHHRWITMDRPEVPADGKATIVADLQAHLPPDWERMLADAALAGRPVFHAKQLSESLTGKVEIEHLSENSLGSLLPNLAYRGFKRSLDLAICIVLLPVLAIPFLIVALAVKLDSPGPAFFHQERVGYRGKSFLVHKFRTMYHATSSDMQITREAAMTLRDDYRITRLGRILRRTRIDELPQVFNVLVGEMSLIGPRPEAVLLATWYEKSLPFYSYRHIVRPGITGWAQVNQGHVVDLQDVHVKLHYDFFYIKNFSGWLDALITLRTIAIILTGFGSK